MEFPFRLKTGHETCINLIVQQLEDQGFHCKKEFKVINTKRRKLIIDIYAKKENRIILYEVGSISKRSWPNRLEQLRRIFPEASIYHQPTLLQYPGMTFYDFITEMRCNGKK